MSLEPGLKGSAETVVVHENTAAAVGSGALEVFATPSMIGLMEKAAMDAVMGDRQTVLAFGRNFNLKVTVFIGVRIGHHQRVFFDGMFGPKVHSAERHRRIRRRLTIDKSKAVRRNTTRTASNLFVVGTGHQPR